MQAITTIGLDIAKSVFQVHGVDAAGNVVVRRQLKRRYVLAFFQRLQPCLVGIEACASSHRWSRELQALGDRCRVDGPAALTSHSRFSQHLPARESLRTCERSRPEPSKPQLVGTLHFRYPAFRVANLRLLLSASRARTLLHRHSEPATNTRSDWLRSNASSSRVQRVERG